MKDSWLWFTKLINNRGGDDKDPTGGDTGTLLEGHGLISAGVCVV